MQSFCENTNKKKKGEKQWMMMKDLEREVLRKHE